MAVVSAHGIEIAYEQHGDPAGTPLLLIHGLGMQLIGWDPEFIAAFTELGYFVTVFDNRDMGMSTWLDQLGTPDFAAILAGDHSLASYLVSDMAADAAGLLDALGIESAHILGVSLGGMIAQQFAIDHTSRTRTLTSIMSTPDARSVGLPTAEAMAALMAPPPTTVAEAMDAAVAAAEVIGSPGFAMDVEMIRAHGALAFERANHPAGTARQMAALLCSTDRRPALGSLAVRALVVHGGSDPLITPEGGMATAEALRGSELWMVPGMGHDLPKELWGELAERHLGLVASTR